MAVTVLFTVTTRSQVRLTMYPRSCSASAALQEERNRKAIKRSLQAPRKKVGRPVMFRSRLQKRRVSKSKDDSHGEDLDEIKHLT